MKIAFMFPGQGTQKVGMCKDIYDKYEEAREIYQKASEILGIDIAKLCFYSDEEELNKTSNTQIAILVTSLAICNVLQKHGIKADVCTGLSLGEYTALMYSEILDFKSGVNIVKKRGQIMQECNFGSEYSMCAIIGIDSKIIEKTCNQVNGFVVPANYNYSNQTVISGYKNSVKEAAEILKNKGARKIIELNTAGPFHTEKLLDASIKLQKELYNYKFKRGTIEVLKNLDGSPYSENEDYVKTLSDHMVNPVRMDKIIKTLKNEGVDLYVEVGPGHTLGGFVKKEIKDAKVISIESIDGINSILNIVKEN